MLVAVFNGVLGASVADGDAAAVLAADVALSTSNATELVGKPKVAAKGKLAHQKYTEHDVNQEDLIFFIGANKAGTTSMEAYFRDMSWKKQGLAWNPCHNKCGGKEWWRASYDHKADSPIWKNHQVFMDNGDHADYQWLFATFNHSRFVMNVRPLRDWVLSRFDMVREIRLNGGCTPVGTTASCKQGWYGVKSDVETWTGNSDADIRAWIYGLAKTQIEQIRFFQANPVRINRFVMVDVTDDTQELTTLRRLHWAQRKKLAEFHVEHLLTMNAQLPVRPHISHLPGPHRLPHSLAASHSTASLRHVERVLMEMGCGPEQWKQYIYEDCMAAIDRSGLELATLPTSPLHASHLPEGWEEEERRGEETSVDTQEEAEADSLEPSPAARAQ